MTKEEMLKEMDKGWWGYDLNQKSSYNNVKKEFREMFNEYKDGGAMFPND